jgi:hypothetical protein
MLVGFQPDASAGKLYLDPALPDWLPELTVMDLRAGQNLFDLRFSRDGPGDALRSLEGRRDRGRAAQLRHRLRAIVVTRRAPAVGANRSSGTKGFAGRLHRMTI